MVATVLVGWSMDGNYTHVYPIRFGHSDVDIIQFINLVGVGIEGNCIIPGWVWGGYDFATAIPEYPYPPHCTRSSLHTPLYDKYNFLNLVFL